KTSATSGAASEAIANVSLLSGTYYVKVATSDNGKGTVNTNYTLTNSVTYYPTDAAANDYKTAADIATLDNWVGFGDSADCYKLTLTGAGSLNLNLTGLSGNANLYLLDSSGRTLKTSATSGAASEAIANVSLLSGTYYVKVATSDNGKGTVNTNYTLTNSVTYYPEDTAGNTLAAAKEVTSSGTLSEWLGLGDKNDYYKFELGSATGTTLELSGLSSNVNLYLYDNKGKQLAVSAKTGAAAESITKSLAAGTYYVKATLTGTANTAYDLNLNIDPSAFKTGSLQLFSSSSTLSNSSDTALAGSDDAMKKNLGLLAS
ncbi:MAG: PPC domain-containing protein, partial [Victivallaceae bacterium]